jgi:hypothetical protein
MIDEKIPFYESDDFLTLDCTENETLNENRSRHGFVRREICSPFSYRNDDLPISEIIVYTNYETNIQICEYLDHIGQVFVFASKNQTQTFQIIKEFVFIAVCTSQIEKNNKRLHNEDK